MNIFVTDENPKACAQALDNQRVNKMITESLQMLATAMRQRGCQEAQLPRTVKGNPMKETHVNHPCSIWARRTRGNYLWLLAHLKELVTEFEYRYGHPHHAASQLAAAERGAKLMPAGPVEPFQNSSMFKERPTLDAYKATLAAKWSKPGASPAWKNRNEPAWRAHAQATATKWSIQ